MALKEYHKIDLQTGIRLDVCLFDDEKVDAEGNLIPIPDDYRLGWGEGIHNPVWSFELNSWIEGKTEQEFLDEARISKDAELNLACKNSILSGFTHVINGIEYWFSYDAEAQANFQGAVTVFDKGLATSINWTVKKDGQYVRIPITPADLDGLLVTILLHKDRNVTKYRDELMPRVISAQTPDEVRAVLWY
jgi:hypothetical protein